MVSFPHPPDGSTLTVSALLSLDVRKAVSDWQIAGDVLMKEVQT
jgi:hypothetical protein